MHIFDPTRATLQEYIAQGSDRRVIYRHRWLRQIRRTVRESDQQGHPESDRLDGLEGSADAVDQEMTLGDRIVSRWEQVKVTIGFSCEKEDDPKTQVGYPGGDKA